MCVAEPKEGGLFMPEIFFLWTAHGAQGCPREQFMSDHRYSGEPVSREVLRATVIAHLLNQVSGQNQQENLLDVSNRFALNSVPALALLKNYSVRVTAEGIKSSKNDLFELWKTWPLPSVIKRDWPTNWIIAINRHTDFNKVHSLASALNATMEQRDVTHLNSEAFSEEFGPQDTTIGDLFPPEVNDMLKAEMKALEMRDRKITYLGAGQEFQSYEELEAKRELKQEASQVGTNLAQEGANRQSGPAGTTEDFCMIDVGPSGLQAGVKAQLPAGPGEDPYHGDNIGDPLKFKVVRSQPKKKYSFHEVNPKKFYLKKKVQQKRAENTVTGLLNESTGTRRAPLRAAALKSIGHYVS